MVKKQYALVDIMGGLGNQLHQICFAKHLEDLGYKVELNPFWFSKKKFNDGTTKRSLELKLELFNFNILSKRQLFIHNLVEKLISFKIFKKLINSNHNKLYRLHQGNNFNEDRYSKINRFTGYWQNPDYLFNKREYLLDKLKKDKRFKIDKEEGGNKSETLIHIRKGDYVNWEESLPDKFYLESLKLLKEKVGNFEYDIFTDEIQINNREKVYREAKNIYTGENEEVLEVFSNMMHYKNYIISNSSFSFFAAYLSSNENTYVIYPDPWFKSLNVEIAKNQGWFPLSSN